QLRQHRRTEPQQTAISSWRLSALLELVEDLGQLLAEENREDRGRSLVRAEPMVVARVCDARPEQVLVALYRPQDRRAEEEELHVLLRRVTRLEQVRALRAERPVQVLAAAVDAGERLLVQQTDQ